MKIVLVEDDDALRTALAELLRRAGHQVSNCPDGAMGLKAVDEADLLVTDLRMPGFDGLSLLREARLRRPSLQVIVMTGYGSIGSAVEAMRLGARAYLTKPFEIEELLLHLREVETLHRLLGIPASGRGDLVGSGTAMRRVYGEIDVAALSDAPVLIVGDTGTGKELAARAIHQASRRAQGPFIAVNCAAISRELIESELFGHESGSFTGAQGRKRGRFALAKGGTLFLDEINSLPLDLQPKLLRAIEAQEIWPVGAEAAERTDLHLLAATNVKLDGLVRAGGFREDLYYRLHVLSVVLPTLREHPEDIPQIVHALLVRAAGGVERHSITATALSNLIARSWPGNVRELANALERALARAAVGQPGISGVSPLTISVEHLDPLPVGSLPVAFKAGRERAAEEWARVAIRNALTRSRGNTSEAARILKMSRTALLRLINKYGLR
jgi:two-component system, NtrC family, response regulator AtoC